MSIRRVSLVSLMKGEDNRTNAVVFLNAGFYPLGHISPFATSHIQYFSILAAPCADSAFARALGKHGMGKASDENRFHPVVEVF